MDHDQHLAAPPPDDSAAVESDALNLKQVARVLGLHYMTVYRYVRQGRLPARRVGAVWLVEAGDLAAFRQPAVGGSSSTSVDWTGRVVDALLAADEVATWKAVQGALTNGHDFSMAHLQLLRGGLGRISDSVSAGRVDASQERVAVGVASRIMCRLGAQFPHRGRKLGAVVLASPPGEYHGLPLALVANLIRHAGFVVIELGIDTPATDLVSTVERVEDLVAVGIGVSAVERVDAAVEMIAQLREAHPTVPVLLGGQAIRNADIAEMVGASSWSAGPDLVETLRVLAVERRRAARQVQSI